MSGNVCQCVDSVLALAPGPGSVKWLIQSYERFTFPERKTPSLPRTWTASVVSFTRKNVICPFAKLGAVDATAIFALPVATKEPVVRVPLTDASFDTVTFPVVDNRLALTFPVTATSPVTLTAPAPDTVMPDTRFGTVRSSAVFAVDGPFARSPGVKLEVYAMLPSNTRAAWMLTGGEEAVGPGTPPIVNG